MGMCREQDSHFAAPGSEVFDANSAGLFTSCLSQEQSLECWTGRVSHRTAHLSLLTLDICQQLAERESTCEMVGVRKAI